MKTKWQNIIGFLLLIIGIASCEREYLYRGDERGLYFSQDTVMFDTVFTSIGSATQTLKIYNPYDEDLTIDAIELAGGNQSLFRININGTPTTSQQDIRIRNSDSLYIFIEITVDPSGDDNPFIVNDSIIFRTKDATQSVQLVAYGQDVIILNQSVLKTQTLKKGKPYLIYDYAVIDSLQEVTIEAGVNIHLHKDASFIVKGSLKAQGTLENPIVFEGDRLESFYADIPGQWGFIQFLPGSKNNHLQHTYIKNSIIGLRVDSIGNGNDAPLILENCRFEHISFVGLLAESSKIIASNTLFADCGLHSAALTVGGHYEFYHCTFANYFKEEWFGLRNTPALLLNNYYTNKNNEVVKVPLTQALFANCIVYGRDYPEIGFDLKTTDATSADKDANYFFDHCLLRIDKNHPDLKNPKRFESVIINSSPSFKNTEKYDYRLDTLSVAQNVGKKAYTQTYPKDFNNVSRITDSAPDFGLYERVEPSK